MRPEDEPPEAPPPSEWIPPTPEQATAVRPSPPTGKDIVVAIVGGSVGAIVGGVAWGSLVRSTETELGIAAIGVGVLAGSGVALFARGKRGLPLQVIAAATATFGILWGKYFAFVLLVRDLREEQFGSVGRAALPLFSRETFSLFTDGSTDLFSGFDVVWLVLAVSTAWWIVARRGSGPIAPPLRRT